VAYLHVVTDAWNRSLPFTVHVIMKARFYAKVYDLVSPGESLVRKPEIKDDEEDETEIVVVKKKKTLA